MRADGGDARFTRMTTSTNPTHVLIAGGGFGGVEAMLALRALAPERVRLTLISTSPLLAYKPAATAESFEETPSLSYDLREIATEVGASLRIDRVEAVAPAAHRVRLASFTHLDYDALVLAVGARASSAIPGALTFRDQHETHHVRRLMSEVGSGAVRRILFAVGRDCSWPLPLYELALLAADRIEQFGVPCEVVLVSAETAPLCLFGPETSRLVAGLLAERGVRFVGESDPQRVDRSGALVLASGETLPADRVLSVPKLRGPRISGLPTDMSGFVTTNALGEVIGLRDVYAAGDMTSYPIKQGGLATQQADAIAQRIASECGAEVTHSRARHVLRARLVGGERPVYLRTELDAFGQATSSTLHGVFDSSEPDTPPEKVFGRYLTPYLHTREPYPATT